MVLFHSVSSATQRSTSWSLLSTATRSAALYLAIQVDVTNLNDVTDVLLSVNWRILTYSKNNVFFYSCWNRSFTTYWLATRVVNCHEFFQHVALQMFLLGGLLFVAVTKVVDSC